jgi:hypothetical protein
LSARSLRHGGLFLVLLGACHGPAPQDSKGGEDSDASDLERCDGLDNDGDGLVDEDFDLDGDGFLQDLPACAGLAQAGDCDDADRFVHPGAAEACDGVDNDCDGVADAPWDQDGDGVASCMGDCDDHDFYRSPATPERCDGQDNDCDAEIDEGFDLDGDGYASCRGDCDDTDPTVHPGAEEACNGIDDDCDPESDESGDLDGDGVALCEGDCVDVDATVYPGAEERCDGLDNDCDGEIDEDLEGTRCLPGCYEVAGTAFWVCLDTRTWEAARDFCVRYGGDLASFSSAREDTAAGTAAASWTRNYLWIGFNDREIEGSWVWSDGSAAAYTGWGEGEPNDSGGEDCACTNWGGYATWNDMTCDYPLPFFCEL